MPLDHHLRIDLRGDEPVSARLGVQMTRLMGFADELADRKDGTRIGLGILGLDLVQRSADQACHGGVTAPENGAGRTARRQIPRLHGIQSEHGGTQRVAQFVHQIAQALVALARLAQQDRLVALRAEFGDRVRDGVVKATIERSKLVDQERRVAFERQVRHGLAQVAIVMHDLVDGVIEREERLAMRCGCHADFRQGGPIASRRAGNSYAGMRVAIALRFQRLDQLLEKHWNTVRQLFCRRIARRTPGDLDRAAGDQVSAIIFEKIT